MEIIDITNKLSEFEKHLNLNRQTILSAKFGDGKTYFLNKYIEQNEQDTFFIVLHPVNYVVSHNEDIFEYIKRDILCSLVHRTEFKETNWVDIFKGIWKSDSILESVETIAEYVPYGKIATIPFRFLEKVNDEYSVNKFFNRFKEKPGGLFEMDQFSVAIQHTIERIQKRGIRSVLIIEDLDRIDPEHLFRILNVLGAHVDEDKNTNKFGFDNIIAVLDYETTEHIFHHFYGAQANYKGYMSKFMSSYPFRYSITQLAQHQLIQYLLGKGCSEELLSSLIIVGKDSNKLVSTLSVINNLSIREVCHTLRDLEAQFEYKTNVHYKGIDIMTSAPIIYFLSVLVRLNLVIRLSELVVFLSRSKERMSILGGFLAASQKNKNGYIRIGDENYMISTIKKGGVESTEFAKYWGVQPSVEIKDLLKDAIHIIQEEICDCSEVCRDE